MAKLEFHIIFGVPTSVIYKALVDPMEIMQYTRAPAQVENKVDGIYRIMDGRIEGQFKSLNENKEINMTWKFNDWKEYSNVQIKFEDREDSTIVRIIQTNIPKDTDLEKLEGGWKSQIFVPMSKMRGYPIEDE